MLLFVTVMLMVLAITVWVAVEMAKDLSGPEFSIRVLMLMCGLCGGASAVLGIVIGVYLKLLM